MVCLHRRSKSLLMVQRINTIADGSTRYHRDPSTTDKGEVGSSSLPRPTNLFLQPEAVVFTRNEQLVFRDVTGNPSGRRDCNEQQLFSTNPAANAARGSRPKLTLSAVSVSYMAGKSSSRNSAGTILAPAGQGVPFKKCCMQTRRYDGAQRNHYVR
jgi:hypothetical protein